MGPQLSELKLSDIDSSIDSILGVCLDGFDGDAWMLETACTWRKCGYGDPQGEDPGGGDKMSGANMPLTAIQKKENIRLHFNPSYSDKSKRVGESHDNRDRIV